MTKQAAIDKIKCFPNWNLDDEWLLEEEMQELSDMAISALEKEVPKKTVKDEYNHDCCPNCGWVVYKDEWGGRYLPHCENCGQAIDWGDV